MLVNIFACSSIGAVLALCVLQSSDKLQSFLARSLVEALEHAWSVRISYADARVNLFAGTMTVMQPRIKSPDDGASFDWSCDRCCINISLFTLLIKSKVRLGLSIQRLVACSLVDVDSYQCALIKHLIDDVLTPQPGMPDIALHELRIDGCQATFVTADKQHTVRAVTDGSFQLAKTRLRLSCASWRGMARADQATVWYNDTLCLHGKDLFLGMDRQRDTGFWHWRTGGKLKPEASSADELVVHGLWDHSAASRIFVHDHAYKSFASVLPGPHGFACKARVSGAWLVEQIPLLASWSDYLFGGRLVCDLDVTTKGITSGIICVDQNNTHIFGLTRLVANIQPSSWQNLHARLTAYASSMFCWKGSAHLQARLPELSLTLQNAALLQPCKQQIGKLGPHLSIAPGGAQCTLLAKKSGISGSYQVATSNQLTGKTIAVAGAYAWDYNICTAAADIGTYKADLAIDRSGQLLRACCQRNGATLLHIDRCADNQQLHGDIAFDLVRCLATRHTKRMLRAKDCWFTFQGAQKGSSIAGSLRMVKGGCYLPAYRNMIQTLQTDLYGDFSDRSISLTNLRVGFSRGRIFVPHARIGFDKQYDMDRLFIPIECTDLFFNLQQRLYGVVYGNLLLQRVAKEHGGIDVSGNLVLARSLLKGDAASLFASPGSFDSALFGRVPLTIGIKLCNQKPIRIQTPHLDGYAHIDLGIACRPSQELFPSPMVVGTINLERSTLNFFDHRLHIEYGKVEFIPHRLNDPVVDLVAKNTINRYQVTLHTTGSLQHPTVTLESNPELTEEQILGLLLAGSEQASMQNNITSAVAHGLSAFLPHSPGQKRTKAIVQKLMRPFKYVQLSPDFDQEPGKNALKGTISVSLNDQVRAQVEKNLMTQDDFSAQVEYLITDDIYLKAVKDKRGEIGCEIEARLKF